MISNSIYLQVRESYKVILVIVGVAIFIQQSSKIPLEFFESSIIASTSITMLPLAVALACFVTSRIYGGSKIFGKSYFLLGLSYVAFFVGEALYYFYMDIQDDYSYSVIADIFFIISMPLLLGYIIINVRYFVEKLEYHQKVLLVVIPVTIFSTYLVMWINSSNENLLSLVLIAESVLVLGFTVVAFTAFRQTALFGPWFLLLVGILCSTTGDILYHYMYNVSLYDFTEPTTGLWLASSMIIIYALYKHQKSI